MIAQGSAPVIADLRPSDSAPLSQRDRQALIAMRAIIDQRLGRSVAEVEDKEETENSETVGRQTKGEDLDTSMDDV